MLENLNGLAGRIKALEAKVDIIDSLLDTNLNATVSSRAAAATALSSANWPTQLSTDLQARITKTQEVQENSIITKLGRDVDVVTTVFHQNSGTQSAYTTILDITSGAGRLLFIGGTGINGGFRVTMDGIVVYNEQAISITDGVQFADNYIYPIPPGCDLIYNTSLKIESYRGSGGGEPSTKYGYTS